MSLTPPPPPRLSPVNKVHTDAVSVKGSHPPHPFPADLSPCGRTMYFTSTAEPALSDSRLTPPPLLQKRKERKERGTVPLSYGGEYDCFTTLRATTSWPAPAGQVPDGAIYVKDAPRDGVSYHPLCRREAVVYSSDGWRNAGLDYGAQRGGPARLP